MAFYSWCCIFQKLVSDDLTLFFRREAQLDIEGQFLVRIIYEDAKTYDLVAAASKVLSKWHHPPLSMSRINHAVCPAWWKKAELHLKQTNRKNNKRVIFRVSVLQKLRQETSCSCLGRCFLSFVKSRDMTRSCECWDRTSVSSCRWAPSLFLCLRNACQYSAQSRAVVDFPVVHVQVLIKH